MTAILAACKSLLLTVLFPLPFTLLLLLGALACLWWTSRQTLGKWLVALAAVVLMGSVAPLWSSWVVTSLERQYPALTSDAALQAVLGVQYIVILGSSYATDAALTPTSRHTKASLTRVIEGLWLHRRLPHAKVILSGGGRGRPEAEVMLDLLIGLGMSIDQVLLEPHSRNTFEEVRQLKTMIGDSRFLLVTSAVHMPRAMALFEASGLHPIAAPTDQSSLAASPIPSSHYLARLEAALYEHIALVKERWMGRI